MIEFKPEINDGLIIYRAFENGVQTGRITLVLNKSAAEIKLVEAADDETAEGLMRSALNAAANRGGYSCVYGTDKFIQVALSLGFIQQGSELYGEIPFLLAGHCSCHNK